MPGPAPIQSLAILGTDRAALPPDLLVQWGIPSDLEPEVQLAQALVLQRQSKRAGFPLPNWEQKEQTKAPLGQNSCSPRAANLLLQVLEGDYADVLIEALGLLEESGQDFPPQSLPALIQRCLEQEKFRDLVLPRIGSLGQWLIGQNPAWQELDSSRFDHLDWELATGIQRFLLLQHLRRENPEHALQLLAQSWDNAAPEWRAQLLLCLEIGLNKKDEVFLEQCLQEKRRETRQAAAELLSVMSNSKLREHYLVFLLDCLSLEKGRLQVKLPIELPEEWKSMGVESTGKGPYTQAQRNAWIEQLIRRIPPSFLRKKFELEASTLCKIFFTQSPAEGWFSALCEAALTHQDETQLEAIVAHWLQNESASGWAGKLGKTLIQTLPQASFNRLLKNYLEKRPHPVEDGQFVTFLLRESTQLWSAELSMLIIRGFREYLSGKSNWFYGADHYTGILHKLSYQCEVSVYPSLQHGWNADFVLYERWHEKIDRMLKVVRFRTSLRTAILETGK
jgi:Family of unknown function (DUF5691)